MSEDNNPNNRAQSRASVMKQDKCFQILKMMSEKLHKSLGTVAMSVFKLSALLGVQVIHLEDPSFKLSSPKLPATKQSTTITFYDFAKEGTWPKASKHSPSPLIIEAETTSKRNTISTTRLYLDDMLDEFVIPLEEQATPPSPHQNHSLHTHSHPHPHPHVLHHHHCHYQLHQTPVHFPHHHRTPPRSRRLKERLTETFSFRKKSSSSPLPPDSPSTPPPSPVMCSSSCEPCKMSSSTSLLSSISLITSPAIAQPISLPPTPSASSAPSNPFSPSSISSITPPPSPTIISTPTRTPTFQLTPNAPFPSSPSYCPSSPAPPPSPSLSPLSYSSSSVTPPSTPTQSPFSPSTSRRKLSLEGEEGEEKDGKEGKEGKEKCTLGRFWSKSSGNTIEDEIIIGKGKRKPLSKKSKFRLRLFESKEKLHVGILFKLI